MKLSKNVKFILLIVMTLVMFFSMASNCNRTDPADDTYNLTIGITGEGSVNPGEGTHKIARDTTVELTVNASEGWEFDSWIGINADDVIEDGDIYKINMNSNKSITARFTSIEDFSGEPYNISGYVYNQEDGGLEGVSISFGDGYTETTTNQDGYWEKSGLLGRIEVKAIYQDYTFSPGFIEVTDSKENINFIGIELEDWHTDIVLYDNARIFPRSEAENIENVSPNRNIIFLKEKTVFVSQLQVGDSILISYPLPNADYGLLKKITEIKNIDLEPGTNFIELYVVPATLSDIIASGEISISRQITFEEMVASFEASDDISVQSIDWDKGMLKFDRKIFSNEYGEIKVKGYIKPHGNIDHDLEAIFERGKPSIGHVIFECGIEAEAKIEAGLFDKSFDWDPKPLYLLGPVELGSYPIFAGVNGVPRLSLVAGSEGNIFAGYSAGVNFERGVKFGAEKTDPDGKWGFVGESTGEGLTAIEPSIKGRANASVFAGIELDLLTRIGYSDKASADAGFGGGIYGNLSGEAEAQIYPEWLWHYDLEFFIDGRAKLIGGIRIFSWVREDDVEIGRRRLFDYPLAYGISGRILDQDGKAMEGIDIEFSSSDVFAIEQTNEDGKWNRHLLNGDVVVTPVSERYKFSPTSRTLSGAESKVDFVATPLDLYEVSGRVTDYTGEGVEGVTINFSGDLNFESVKTDSNGNWSQELYGEITITLEFGEDYTFDPESITVDKERKNVNFLAHHWYNVSGELSTLTEPFNSNVYFYREGAKEYFDYTSSSYGKWSKVLTGKVIISPNEKLDTGSILKVTDQIQGVISSPLIIWTPPFKIVEKAENDLNFLNRSSGGFPPNFDLGGTVFDFNGFGIENVLIKIEFYGDPILDLTTDKNGRWLSQGNFYHGDNITIIPEHSDYNFNPESIDFNISIEPEDNFFEFRAFPK